MIGGSEKCDLACNRHHHGRMPHAKNADQKCVEPWESRICILGAMQKKKVLGEWRRIENAKALQGINGGVMGEAAIAPAQQPQRGKGERKRGIRCGRQTIEAQPKHLLRRPAPHPCNSRLSAATIIRGVDGLNSGTIENMNLSVTSIHHKNEGVGLYFLA